MTTLLWLSLSALWATCLSTTADPLWVQQKDQIEKRITDAAHLIEISKEADRVLLKLTEKKSPVLLSWLEKNQLTQAQETKIAEQWRTYYWQEFILNSFPTPNPQINQTVEALFLDLENQYFNSASRKKLLMAYQKSLSPSLGDILKRDDLILEALPSPRFDAQSVLPLKRGYFQNRPKVWVNTTLIRDKNNNRLLWGLNLNTQTDEQNLQSAFRLLQFQAAFEKANTSSPIIQNTLSCFKQSKDTALNNDILALWFWAQERVRELKSNDSQALELSLCQTLNTLRWDEPLFIDLISRAAQNPHLFLTAPLDSSFCSAKANR